MIDLIFINLYGTILPENRELILRKGFLEFLERYKSIHIAISTYAPKDIAIHDLKGVGLIDKFKNVYAQEDMHLIRVYNKARNDLKDGIPQPDLRTWARSDFHTNEENAIVISDNLLDMMAADWYNVKAIEIPVFKNDHDNFSFDNISVGSWYNDVKYFIHRLREKPMRISLK